MVPTLLCWLPGANPPETPRNGGVAQPPQTPPAPPRPPAAPCGPLRPPAAQLGPRYAREVTTQLRDTPLRAVHERLGATMTEFAGWLMPLRYGSETAEHNAVRTSAALFDLSHMGEIAVTGPGAAEALDYAVCGWPSQLAPGRARYTMLCAPDGGVLDDLVIYRQSPDRFLVVANAANTAVVLGELQRRSAGAVVQDETEVTGLIAIQGPNAPGILSRVTDLPLGDMRYYAGAA